MLMGMLGSYSQRLPNYKIQQQAPGSATPAEERKVVAKLWELPDLLALLEQIKEEVMNGLDLACPDYGWRFYLKAGWSQHGMAAVLCQADPDCPESVVAEKSENASSPCLHEKAKTGPHLIPILFMASLCTALEDDYHLYKGESTTGLWATSKNGKFLSWKAFSWISGCSRLRQFFESAASIAAGTSTNGNQS